MASANTLNAMEQAKKKPAKYRIAEVMGNLVLNSDRGNSWNAVRSLRSMAATVVSMVVDVIVVVVVLETSCSETSKDEHEGAVDVSVGIGLKLFPEESSSRLVTSPLCRIPFSCLIRLQLCYL